MKIGGAMRIPLLIGSIVLLAACAGAQRRPENDEPVSGRWQGVLLRNGLRAPIAVELSGQDRDWRGRFSAGVNSVPLQDVRVTATSVHFELRRGHLRRRGRGRLDGRIDLRPGERIVRAHAARCQRAELDDVAVRALTGCCSEAPGGSPLRRRDPHIDWSASGSVRVIVSECVRYVSIEATTTRA